METYKMNFLVLHICSTALLVEFVFSEINILNTDLYGTSSFKLNQK